MNANHALDELENLTVPAEWPSDFDFNWMPDNDNKKWLPIKHVLLPEERERVQKMLQGIGLRP